MPDEDDLGKGKGKGKGRGKGKITWLRFKCRSRAVRKITTRGMETLCPMKTTWEKEREKAKVEEKGNGQLHNSLSQDLRHPLKVT